MKRAVSIAAACLAIGACSEDGRPPAKKVETPAKTAAPPAAPAATNIRVEARDGRMLTQVGTKQPDGQLVSSGRPGILMFGPYARWAPGKYRVTVYGKVIEGGKEAGWVDVISAKGAKQLAKVNLNGPAQGSAAGDMGSLTTLDFSLDQAVEDLEVRAWANQGARIAITAYEIAPAN